MRTPGVAKSVPTLAACGVPSPLTLPQVELNRKTATGQFWNYRLLCNLCSATLLCTVGRPPNEVRTPMHTRITRAILFALYQTSVAASIALLPLALLTRQAGVTLPAHKIVNRLERAYDTTA